MTDFKHIDKIYLDIETVGDKSPWVKEYLCSNVSAPSNYKDPDKIQAYMDAEVGKTLSKAGLDGAFCNIACIGVAINNNDVITFSLVDDPEETVLNRFYDYIQTYSPTSPVFIGHNVAGFDLKIIKQRSMILGIEPPKVLQTAFNAKPWDGVIFDTMLAWDAKNFTKQEKIALAFGLEGKDGMDGSQVQEYFDAGRYEEIAEYCANDVKTVRAIYKKMNYLTEKELKECQQVA